MQVLVLRRLLDGFHRCRQTLICGKVVAGSQPDDGAAKSHVPRPAHKRLLATAVLDEPAVRDLGDLAAGDRTENVSRLLDEGIVSLITRSRCERDLPGKMDLLAARESAATNRGLEVLVRDSRIRAGSIRCFRGECIILVRLPGLLMGALPAALVIDVTEELLGDHVELLLVAQVLVRELAEEVLVLLIDLLTCAFVIGPVVIVRGGNLVRPDDFTVLLRDLDLDHGLDEGSLQGELHGVEGHKLLDPVSMIALLVGDLERVEGDDEVVAAKAASGLTMPSKEDARDRLGGELGQALEDGSRRSVVDEGPEGQHPALEVLAVHDPP